MLFLLFGTFSYDSKIGQNIFDILDIKDIDLMFYRHNVTNFRTPVNHCNYIIQSINGVKL